MLKRLLIIAAIYFGAKFLFTDYLIKTYVSIIKRVRANYSVEVDRICEDRDLPAHYFKALIVLECGGNRPAKARFENGVFEQLKLVRNGKKDRYGYVRPTHLAGASDATLKLLATSWGPLQVMGYHCFELGVGIDQLKGNNGLYWSILWCEKTYGKFLKSRDYKDAFHMHNAGKPFPVFGCTGTHDPQYVYRGMKYLAAFR